jgi:small subunit ribosomal protein S1
VKGGLSVDVGLKAFLPDRRTDAPLGDGQKSRFWVRDWDERKDTFLLAREPRSARDVREARKNKPRETEIEAGADGEAGAERVAPAPATPVTLPAEGEVLKGRVARLADFGAFVELPGGATGLLHVKDMSWGRVQHPADVVSIGDEVEVKVLKIQAAGEGSKGDRIQLSRRVLLPAPWATVSDRLRVGQKVSGPVISFAEYGAFVEIEPGVEGMVHVSEIGWGNPKHPSDALSVGERVEAEIIHLDPEKKHLKLSIKKLKGSPFGLMREKFPVGTRVHGVVKNVANFGVFVTLDAENGFEGLVHTSDLSWTPLNKIAGHFPVGREVEAIVLGFDEERGRCSLGIKQLTAEPVRPSLDADDVNGGRVLLETHCLDWPASLGAEGAYGKIARVELLHKLHDELKYEGLEALTRGIHQDCDDARAWLAARI